MKQTYPVIKNISVLAITLEVTEEHLRHMANIACKSYKCRDEKKPTGGTRKISSPSKPLKLLQKTLHKKLLSKLIHSRDSHYGLKGKSNITNALVHRDSKVIFSCDLKSFFPSVSPKRVMNAFVEELQFPVEVAKFLTRLVTYDYQLPQGAPTSTDIANLVTLRLQRRLYGLVKQWGLKEFSILADDITFSGDKIPDGFEEIVYRITKEEGFTIHPDKSQKADKSKNQTITGLNVAHGVTVGNKKKNWRAELHNNTVHLKNGEISNADYATALQKYNSRLIYAESVKKLASAR